LEEHILAHFYCSDELGAVPAARGFSEPNNGERAGRQSLALDEEFAARGGSWRSFDPRGLLACRVTG
jgi:hypothetical protein